MRRTLCAGMVLAVLISAGTGGQGGAQHATISGPATVIDGDGVRIGGASIRLWGIDAPEMDQTCIAQSGERYTCGAVSRDALARLIAGHVVLCRILGIDRYNRALGECFTANSTDAQSINAQLVRDGMAVAYERYSRAYVAEQEEAKRAKRGLWSGLFELPASHRGRQHDGP